MGKQSLSVQRVFIKFTNHEWHFPFSWDLNKGVKGRFVVKARAEYESIVSFCDSATEFLLLLFCVQHQWSKAISKKEKKFLPAFDS